MNYHGHTEEGFEMPPTTAAQHLLDDHDRGDLATTEGVDLALEHRRLHGAVRETPAMAVDRALDQARLYLENAGPTGPVKLREAIGRIDAPTNISPELVLNGRLNQELALEMAVRVVALQPAMLGVGVGQTDLAAEKIASMARILRAMLDEE